MRLSILAKIIDMLSPRYCPVCGNRLNGEEESICVSCNLFLPRTDTWKDPYNNEMAKMFWHRIPIEKACSLFYYKGHAFTSNILYQLKYSHRPEVATDLGILLAQEGMKVHFFDNIDGIIPIPLAPHRQRQRGYNQSEEIAKGIAQVTHLPIYTNIVRRNENVKEAFELYLSYRPDQEKGKNKSGSIAGRHFLMVDDVCTTGATICACCQTLLKAGNMKFSVLSIGLAGE